MIASTFTPLIGFIGGMGFMEMALIGMVAVLLFGKNLPEVARKLGGTYQQFRKGLTEFQGSIDLSSDIDNAGRTPSRPRYDDYDDYEEVAAPKFAPPPAPSNDEESKVAS